MGLINGVTNIYISNYKTLQIAHPSHYKLFRKFFFAMGQLSS